MEKSLDTKLAAIHADPSCKEFIIADAKDADITSGIRATGRSPENYELDGRYRSLEEFREQIRQIVRQGIVDIMLMSPHTNGTLTIKERLFDNSSVTPAARANDTTDIHLIRGGGYRSAASRPYRSATIEQLQCGKASCSAQEVHLGANLGLYSVTFNNCPDLDSRTLREYREFRIEAEKKGFRHFLEVFDPNEPGRVEPDLIGPFVNDHIVRMLAGVPEVGRPLFLKMVYHGPKLTEELVNYDPHLVVGVLGGPSGTTYDAFKLIAEARKYGAKAGLYGRKINDAEHQLAFIQFLRLIVEGQVTAEEAVHAYHGVLQGLGIKPRRSLQEDMQIQTDVLGYLSAPGVKRVRSAAAQRSGRTRFDGPDWSAMSKEERLAYHLGRINGRFGHRRERE